MLKINVNENLAHIERGDTDPETTLAELQVACQGALKDVSKRTNRRYGEVVDMFTGMIN